MNCKLQIEKNGLNQYIVIRIDEGGSSLFDYKTYSYMYRRLETGHWFFAYDSHRVHFFESLKEAEDAVEQYRLQATWEIVKTYEDL